MLIIGLCAVQEVDSLDVAYIRDTRTGKHARLPKVRRRPLIPSPLMAGLSGLPVKPIMLMSRLMIMLSVELVSIIVIIFQLSL